MQARDRGVTVLLSSHILAETEALCKRVTSFAPVKPWKAEVWNRCATSAARRSRPIAGDPGDLSRIKGVEDISMEGNILHAEVDADSLAS